MYDVYLPHQIPFREVTSDFRFVQFFHVKSRGHGCKVYNVSHAKYTCETNILCLPYFNNISVPIYAIHIFRKTIFKFSIPHTSALSYTHRNTNVVNGSVRLHAFIYSHGSGYKQFIHFHKKQFTPRYSIFQFSWKSNT